MADETIFSFIPNGNESLSLNDAFVPNIRFGYNFLISPTDDCKTLFIKPALSVAHLSEQTEFLCSIEKNMKLGIMDGKHVNPTVGKEMILTPKDRANPRLLSTFNTLVPTSEKMGYHFEEDSDGANLMNDEMEQKILMKSNNDKCTVSDALLERMYGKFIEYPYMFDKTNSYAFTLKPEEVNVSSHIADASLIHQNSNISLNDEISIK
jgi:hypothetical protein